jgi:hypothetical protein
LNEPKQDGQKERPQRQCKEWPYDWWVTTKKVERATIVFSKEPRIVEEALKIEKQRSGRLPCKNNTIIFLSTTFGPWCHIPRVGSPFLINGYLNSSMGSMVKSNVTRHEVSPKHLE